ncbi:MAG: hypothetical protein ABJO01_02930 [Parasphingorhabdus sp.]|uniref:hypothetical protein n=1 Tax=Parasphingorhabdus sp. TaxID=2709688 RepID=UPI00329689F9
MVDPAKSLQNSPAIYADHKAAKRQIFLDHLAISSSVRQAREVAGIANSTLHFWRDNDPDFAAAWLKALVEGYDLLEMEMLERARTGVERKIYYQGHLVEAARDYDHKTALQLLRMHKESVASVRAAKVELAAHPEQAHDQLEEKLKQVNLRLGAFRAEKQRAQQTGSDPNAATQNGVAYDE